MVFIHREHDLQTDHQRTRGTQRNFMELIETITVKAGITKQDIHNTKSCKKNSFDMSEMPIRLNSLSNVNVYKFFIKF